MRFRSFFLCLTAGVIAARAQQPQNNPPKLERNPAASLPTPAAAPKQGKTNVRFVGITHFKENALRAAIAEQISAIDAETLSPALADDAAFFLGIFYRKNGYSQVEVKWQIEGPRNLLLTVSEGPLTSLGDISFRGVAGEPEATLRDYVVGTTRERFPRTKTGMPFVQSDVGTGVERIRGLYRSEGFLDSVVEDPVVTLTPDKKRADVLVKVTEGTRYYFGKLEMTGDIVFFSGGNPDFPNAELLKELEPFTKKPYTPQQVVNMQRAVVYFYKKRGYYNAKVEVESDPATSKNGAVPVKFLVDSGNIYRFDGVSQEGLDRLSAKFLPRRFAKLNNRFYDPQLLDERFREMMRTGLFKQLRIEPRPQPDNTIELHMKVEEAKAKELGFSAGYGTFEGPILGFSAGDRDLFGTGRPLTSSVQVSQRFLRGEILYQDPWFFESDYALRVRLYGLSASFDGYSKLETGLRAELARKLTKKLEASVFVLGRDLKITDDGIDPLELGATSYVVNSLGASLTLDTRDSPINPGRGFVANATSDFASSALGSGVEFVRGTARFSYYLPIKKTLFAFGARGGIIEPLSGDRLGIPIDERFFNGGSRSVRSFAERELGPEDRHGYPIGGDVFTVLNAEYEFPIWGDLLGAVFIDAGSVGQEPGALGDMRYGVGGGLRYRSPVGPLRIDYGINPSPRGTEKSGALHISFGTAF
ncbi:MAG: outer membrane protein insertion porin family [Chthoniobacter sp.]|jgi:outer membrane protein assembly complex protein YaeT|nr:outer membrane protein insertion porin family [Chthoniobacter sp.]